jgi:FkbM family methyltransferase
VQVNQEDSGFAHVYRELLVRAGLHPVLLDIGASVAPPEIWTAIARQSTYVGFDPDLRELKTDTDRVFAKAIIVNKAVTCQKDADRVHFYFTQSPTCSSTLSPDRAALSDYLFADLFTVEREGSVEAITLDAVIERLALPGIDWVKTDSQGTDIRLFESLRPELRSKVLAIDLEPGLIDAYVGEDLFVDVHKRLVHSGFWLSNLDVQGTVRMRKTTLDRLKTMEPSEAIEQSVGSLKIAPGWVNARYLRTLSSLCTGESSRREYLLLWVFACLDQQFGFAADVAFEYEDRFGRDETSCVMLETVQQHLQAIGRRNHTVFKKAKSWLSFASCK